eukprot:TRINITY_DN12160_c0_g1_i1.p1 TRINITY_DN12160_c0_g1~~TRINITY_DN12160_c0_g1_i1.p1  ORF type:complete len:210 (-),score=44.27 TRINITY_DN12160_c0_g1_i1:66-695(-)
MNDIDEDSVKNILEKGSWDKIFNTVFDRDKLIDLFGEEAVSYSMEKSFARHFSEVFKYAIETYDVDNNYFLHQIFFDHYNRLSLPEYMDQDVYNALQSIPSGKLEIYEGDFWQYDARDIKEKYDFIQTSNISDWMPVPKLHELIQEISEEMLQPGGVLLMRRLNGDHNLEEIVSDYLVSDPDENELLKHKDRSFFYSELVVGLKRVSIE